MANGDYGYFGKGSTGYAQYMTAFNRNFGGSSGGGGGGGNHNNGGGGGGDGSGSGCLIAIVAVVVLVLLAMGSGGYPHSTGLPCVTRSQKKLTRKCYHIVTGNTTNIPMEDCNR